MLALDLDLAISTRARSARDERVNEILESEEGGGFFSAVLTLLSE